MIVDVHNQAESVDDHTRDPSSTKDHHNQLKLLEVLKLAELMASVLLFTSCDSVKWELTPDQVSTFISQATESLGLDVIYDTNTFESMGLKEFTSANWEINDSQLISGTHLDTILSVASSPLRLRGESAEQLRHSFRKHSCHKAIDILNVGQRVCTPPSFRPNGGVGTSISRSYLNEYLKMRQICNHAMLKMVQ